jgi:hypothetical protein
MNIEQHATDKDLLEGYDFDDPFIDNTENSREKKNEEADNSSMDTKHGGFFINSGKLELIPLSEINKDETYFVPPDSPPKEEVPVLQLSTTIPSDTLHPDLESAIKELQDATPKDLSTRFPKELEPHLAKVARVAHKLHPKGFLTNDIFVRLAVFLPFKKTTLKSKMKKFINDE